MLSNVFNPSPSVCQWWSHGVSTLHLLLGLCLTKLEAPPEDTHFPHLISNSWHCDPILCEVLSDIFSQSQMYLWVANSLHNDHRQTKWDFWLGSLCTSEWRSQWFGRPNLSTPSRQVILSCLRVSHWMCSGHDNRWGSPRHASNMGYISNLYWEHLRIQMEEPPAKKGNYTLHCSPYWHCESDQDK